MSAPDPGLLLKRLAARALAAADAGRAVRAALREQPLTGPVRLLVLGKAAAPMWRVAVESLAPQLRAALIIAPAPPTAPLSAPCPVRWLVGAHPIPDHRSLLAGEAACEFVAAGSADETLLVLLSGGASALCEKLPASVSLQELQRLQQALLAADLPITAINAVRQRLSDIKAGGLARRARGPICQLLVSDVPDDDPAAIGSAPFLPQRLPLPPREQLPSGWRTWCDHQLDRTEPLSLAVPVNSRVIVSNRKVRQAIRDEAVQQRWSVQAERAYNGSVEAVAQELASCVLAGAPGLYLFGGECHVQLPTVPGRGGRNQHLALLLAEATTSSDITWLTLATDGVDGHADAAGVLLRAGNPSVAERRQRAHAIAMASSYDYWRTRGGLLFTGPTGCNVADLVLAWKTGCGGAGQMK